MFHSKIILVNLTKNKLPDSKSFVALTLVSDLLVVADVSAGVRVLALVHVASALIRVVATVVLSNI
jgi:hypothetical protein